MVTCFKKVVCLKKKKNYVREAPFPSIRVKGHRTSIKTPTYIMCVNISTHTHTHILVSWAFPHVYMSD